jgi:replicative DNA helicase
MKHGNISCNKNHLEIIDYLKKYAKRLNGFIKISNEKENCFDIEIVTKNNYIRNCLREYNIFKKKEIPKEYLLSSKNNRLELLAGLIDTDGFVLNANRKCYGISQKRKNIIESLIFIARTLRLTSSDIKRKEYFDNRTKKLYSCYYIQIGGQVWNIPVKLNYKKIEKTPMKQNPFKKNIKVEYDGIGDYYGFTLDQDGLFLLEDMTVTHNTSFANALFLNLSREDQQGLYFSYENTMDVLAGDLMAAMYRMPNTKFRRNMFTDDDIKRIEAIEESPALKNDSIGDRDKNTKWIYESANYDVYGIRRQTEKMMDKYKIKFVIIDYFQIINRSHRRGQTEEYENMVGYLRQMKNELGIAVFLLSQVGRDEGQKYIHKKKDEDPKSQSYIKMVLNELKGTGNLEQEADEVLGLEGYRKGNKRVIHVAKSRLRGLSRIGIEFDFTKSLLLDKKFDEIDYDDPERWMGMVDYYNPNQEQEENTVTEDDDDISF